MNELENFCILNAHTNTTHLVTCLFLCFWSLIQTSTNPGINDMYTRVCIVYKEKGRVSTVLGSFAVVFLLFLHFIHSSNTVLFLVYLKTFNVIDSVHFIFFHSFINFFYYKTLWMIFFMILFENEKNILTIKLRKIGKVLYWAKRLGTRRSWEKKEMLLLKSNNKKNVKL